MRLSKQVLLWLKECLFIHCKRQDIYMASCRTSKQRTKKSVKCQLLTKRTIVQFHSKLDVMPGSFERHSLKPDRSAGMLEISAESA
jgi:hypothetical protein